MRLLWLILFVTLSTVTLRADDTDNPVSDEPAESTVDKLNSIDLSGGHHGAMDPGTDALQGQQLTAPKPIPVTETPAPPTKEQIEAQKLQKKILPAELSENPDAQKAAPASASGSC